jgi:potassium channel subfamily K
MPHTQDADEVENRGRGDASRASLRREKIWWNMFKRWKDGEESDWWFASTGIP